MLKVNAPTDAEIAQLAPGSTIIGLLAPAFKPELLEALAARGVTALAMDAVPRISRAQSMDVLSSMANISGYRAVVEAAHEFGRFFTGQVTAAGKVPPAKVLVAGAGVAGLAAIGAASSLGAIVRATDPRPEVADQVKSIGGEYLKVEVEVEQSTDGYAKATSEAYDRRAADIYSEQARDVDIIITTALIPGPARAQADHGGGCREHEVGQRHRRHGCRAGRKRRGLGRGRAHRHAERRHHPGLHRPRVPPPHSGLAAVRHERGEPREAADAGEGRRARARLRRHRAALGHRRRATAR